MDECGCGTLLSALQASGVQHVFAVAGQPITHAAELAAERHPGFEWSVNEKVALECAVGLSAVGARSAVLIKQCGLNVALDPLINGAFHTTNGALLLAVGDDVGATSSTCEQDSRVLAKAASVPVLEPRDGSDISTTVSTAVLLSESTETPVIVRVTNELHRAFAAGAVAPSPAAARRPRSADIAFGLSKLGRQQYRRIVAWPRVRAMVDSAGLVRVTCRPPCRTGVLAVGAAAGLFADLAPGYCRAVSSASWPLPADAVHFVQAHEDILVLEAPSPFVESELRLLDASTGSPRTGTVRGRLTGHLPPEGPLSPAAVAAAVAPDAQVPPWTEIARRRTDASDEPPPYDAVFRAVARVRREGVFVATDVGSAVRLCYPPYLGADVSLCLGSAISVAAGAARAGRPSIAVIGDFALLHSGLEALIDTARHPLPVVVLVLLNGVQAQTGGQPSAGGAGPDGPDGLLLQRLVNAAGAQVLADVRLGDHDERSMDALIAGWLTDRLPGVALLRHGAGEIHHALVTARLAERTTT